MLKDLKKYNKIAGIYCIYNKLNGKRYIGSSKNIYQRLHSHMSELKHNKHGNDHLQLAWNKYKEENFGIIIIEIVRDISKLEEIEQFYIDNLFCCDDRFGYNIRPKADRSEMSEETKIKIGLASKGRIPSEETRRKISESLKCIEITHEHRQKMAETRKANIREPEKVKKIKELYNKGYKCTDIEKEVGLSRPTIRKILREVGKFGRGRSFKNLNGKEHGNWKGGRPLCQGGCGKVLSKYKYTRCVKCAGKVYKRRNTGATK